MGQERAARRCEPTECERASASQPQLRETAQATTAAAAKTQTHAHRLCVTAAMATAAAVPRHRSQRSARAVRIQPQFGRPSSGTFAKKLRAGRTYFGFITDGRLWGELHFGGF